MFPTDVGAHLVFKHQTVNSHENPQLISWLVNLPPSENNDLIRPYLRETTCHISGAWVPQWGREVDMSPMMSSPMATGSRL